MPPIFSRATITLGMGPRSSFQVFSQDSVVVCLRCIDESTSDLQVELAETRRLCEARTCTVCMDRQVNTVFLPCRHLVCSDTCSPVLRNCAVSRSLIRELSSYHPRHRQGVPRVIAVCFRHFHLASCTG